MCFLQYVVYSVRKDVRCKIVYFGYDFFVIKVKNVFGVMSKEEIDNFNILNNFFIN